MGNWQLWRVVEGCGRFSKTASSRRVMEVIWVSSYPVIRGTQRT